MKKTWISLLLGIAFAFCAAVPAAAAPAGGTPPTHALFVDTGGFPRTVRSLLAELQLEQNREFRVFLDDAELQPDALVATGQFLSYGTHEAPMQDGVLLVVPGDVLGTGKVGIGQIVRIARALSGAEPLQGIWLLAGDMDHSGRIDLSDLVKAVSQMLTVQDAENADFTAGVYPLYFETPSQRVDIPLYFAGTSTDVPYISTRTLNALLGRIFGELWGEQPPVLEQNGACAVIRRADGQTAEIDFDAHEIRFQTYNAFLGAPQAALLDVVSVMPAHEDGTAKYIQRVPGSFGRAGRPVTITLEDYGIETALKGDTGYIPLQTFSDIFLTPLGCCIAYNGRMAAITSLRDPYSLISLYYEAPAGPRSTELSDFTYNEMCLALDLLYGLKEQQNIESFDALCRETKLYEALHSEDPFTADCAVRTLTDGYLGDVHTCFLAPSWYAGQSAHVTSSASPVSMDAFAAYYADAVAARSHAFPDGVPAYQEIGDTAFITLDNFTFDPDADYYTAAPGPDAQDTVGIIAYAHECITRENSPVRNVVLDLSCNLGGDLDAAVYALAWLAGTATINLNDACTGAQACVRYRSDVNLDGRCDDADSVSSLHCACLVSSASFSAANLAATVLEGTTVQLIGQRTGGGSCSILPLTLADGTVLRISGPLQASAMQNGSYYDTDRGVEPAYRIMRIENFYNRAGLCRMLEGIFETNPQQTRRSE